ncbi:MAG: cytochrome P450, partial [Alphaproteobacteria bacterium]
MTPIPTTDLSVDEIRLGQPETWLRPDREGIFAKLRAERPVSFQEEPEVPGFPKGPGYWAIVRHADVMQVSRDAETFISGRGSNIADLPVEMNEFFGSMINMDAPKHTKLRKLVNKGFTPRMVGRIEEQVRTQARSIVDSIAERGECEFVGDVAARLPLQIICDMMGIPPTDHARILELTNVILGVGDPEYVTTMEGLMAAGLELFQYAQAMGEDRLATPRDDITSALMHAEVDGDRLTAQELGSFFILLVVAGNETTRNAISHGMHALTHNPEQRRTWFDNFDS